MKTRFPRAWRWLRLDRYFDGLFGFWEDAGRAARKKLQRWLEAADKRVPRALPRPRVQLACEGLENRFMMTTVQFSAATFNTLQTSSSVTVTVTLDALPTSTVTVDYGTSDNTAYAGRDYTTTSGMLTFTTSDLTKTFTVPILNDGVTQSDDAFTVTLSSPTNATLGSPSTAAVDITNEHWPVPTASSTPESITTGPDGNLWFVENTANKIAKMTTSGTFTEYTIPTSSSAPTSIVAGPDGNLWFVESSGNKVAKVTTTGTFTEYTLPNSGSDPDSIAVGPDGNLWFAEGSGDRIGKITTAGTITEYTPIGMSDPYSIIAGPDGKLWFGDGSNLDNITTSGTLTVVASGADVNFLTVGPDGNIWYTTNTAVEAITLKATALNGPEVGDGENGFIQLEGITAGPDGNIWFVDQGANVIYQMTPSGTTTAYSGISNTDPYSITTGPDGNLWFTEISSNKVGRLSGLVTGVPRSNDPVQAGTVPIGGTPFGNVTLYPETGSFLVSNPFDLSAGAGAATVGPAPALVYVSSAVHDQPIIEVTYRSDPGAAVPTSLEARLTWNHGTPGSWVSFSTTGHSAGDVYDLGLQVSSPVTSASNYQYTVDVQAVISGQTVTRSFTSYLAVVPLDSSNALGNGWSMAGLDLMTLVALGTFSSGSGVILVDGATGSTRFFAQPASGSTFVSPPNDQGTLTESGSFFSYTFTYTNTAETVYSFNSSGEMTSVVNAAGVAVTFLWSSGLLTLVENPDGSVTTFSYNGSNELQSIQGPGSRTVSVTINGSGNLTNLENPDGSLLTFTYDGSNRMTNEQSGSVSTTFSYSAGNGTLTTITLDASDSLKVSAADTVALGTSPAANLSQAVAVVTDQAGHATTFAYDNLGRLLTQSNPDGSVDQWTYDFAGQPVKVTDGLGNVTTMGYQYGSSDGNEQNATSPDGTSHHYTYDSNNNLLTDTDPLGYTYTYTYNGSNELLTKTDPTGAVTTNTWSGGLLQTTTDPLGHVTSYTYTAARQVQTVTNALGGVTTYGYDAAGDQTSVTDPLGRITTSLFDAMGRVTEVIQPGGQTAYSYYNGLGEVTETVDALGNATTFAYDDQGRQTSSTAAAGTALAATTYDYYDGNGNVTGVKDPNGNLTKDYYDALNRLTGTRDPLNNLSQTLYNADSQITETVDGVGNATTFAYDVDGRQISETQAAGTALAATSYTYYDADSRVTGTRDALGNLTQNYYDADGRLTGTKDPLNNLSKTLYDHAGNVTETVDANNNATQYVFDALGRQSVVVDALGGRMTTLFNADSQVTGMLDQLDRATTFLLDADGRTTAVIDPTGAETYQYFDANGNVTESKDGNGNATTFAYDALGRLTLTTDAKGDTSKNFYDADGNVTEVIDANNNATQYLFDAAGRQTVVIDAVGNRVTSLFNADGRVTQVTDGSGNITQYGYDAAGRQNTVTDGTGQVTTTLFDAVGNATQVTDPLGHSTQYQFDADGRLTVTIDSLTSRTTQLYDAVGNMTYLKDASNNVTTFAYDALNRKTAETPAIGSTTFAYNAVGDETSTTDALGQQTTFSYDGDNRETGQTTLNTGGSLQDRATFSYDAAGNMLTASNSQGTYTMLYNALNQVTLVHELFGQSLTFTYDAAGNRTVVQDNFGTETSTYDGDNRLQQREYAGISTTQVRIGVGYQGNGELSSMTRFNMLGGPSLPIGTATYLYDAADRVTSITDYNGSGTALLSYVYSYDHAGNLSQEVDNGTAVTYGYDTDNQLTSQGSATESYNATGNRNGTGYTSTSDNELSSDGTWNNSYNADGEETQKVNIATGETWTYAYNNAGEMTSAVDKTSGGTVLSSSAYDYDAFGNRVEQDVTVSGTTTVQRYAYDGWNSATQRGIGNTKWEVFADLDGSNNLQTRYLRGDEVDQLFARIGSTGTAAWLLTDHLGSVVGVTDNNGTLQDTIAYDAFGNIKSQSNFSWTGQYGWTGRELDTTTGLQYNRARYYNPATGQWTSQDPMGFDAGDSNLYRYALNHFTINLDRSGLDDLDMLGNPVNGLQLKKKTPEPPTPFEKEKRPGMGNNYPLPPAKRMKLPPPPAILEIIDGVMQFNPVYGTGRGVIEAITGEDFLTLEPLSPDERLLAPLRLPVILRPNKGAGGSGVGRNGTPGGSAGGSGGGANGTASGGGGGQSNMGGGGGGGGGGSGGSSSPSPGPGGDGASQGTLTGPGVRRRQQNQRGAQELQQRIDSLRQQMEQANQAGDTWAARDLARLLSRALRELADLGGVN